MRSTSSSMRKGYTGKGSTSNIQHPTPDEWATLIMSCFHSSIEGAQHGAKPLADFLAYARRSGASGAQPSNYMLQGGKLFKSAKEIKAAFGDAGLSIDGVS